MSAQLASLLTWGLIFFLLVRDCRNAPKTQVGLWLPLTWILILGSRAPSYWFASDTSGMGVEAYEEGNALNQQVYLALITLGIIVLVRRSVDWGDILRRNRALFAFLAYCVLSALWADYPLVTIKGTIKAMFGNIVMVLIVITDPNPAEAIKALIRRCGFVLVPLSVLVIKYFPAIGRETHRWSYETMFQGVATGPNGLAATCYICGLLVVASLVQKGALHNKREFGLNLVMLVPIVWLLNKGDGATALLSMLVGISILVLIKRDRSRRIVSFVARNMGIALVVVTPSLVLNYEWVMETVGTVVGHSETLWGRFELWKVLVGMSGNPILGMGYGNFWQGERMESLWAVYSWHPTQAHNGYLETYLNLGFVGLTLLAVLIVSASKKAASTALRPELQFLKLPYLLPIVLYNLTEAAFRGLHIVWFAFLLFALETKLQMQDRKPDDEALVEPDRVSIPNRFHGRRVVTAQAVSTSFARRNRENPTANNPGHAPRHSRPRFSGRH
ncbi:MAG TPA: O-antigen ligase family protein [Vicinamibacterales bacterium]|nr:O-antigen ligase family protein [Vicinamibacterales bacterium]